MKAPNILVGLSTLLAICIGGAHQGHAGQVVLPNVPAYAWYHGCAPTAAASIMGYWDLHGFDGLMDASGWAAVKELDNVKEQVSSTAHNAKYDPYPDAAGDPPPDTSLADFFHTSEDDLGFGWSYFNTSVVNAVFKTYPQIRGYPGFITDNYPDSYVGYWTFGSQTVTYNWNWLKEQIDAGRPMMFLVQTSHAGVSDHFVPVVGYDEQDPGDSAQWYYGVYTVQNDESETVAWFQFKASTGDNDWGVKIMITIKPDMSLVDTLGLSDVIKVCQSSAGIGAPGITFHHDRNKDGRVDTADAIALLQEIAGLRP